MDREPEWQVVSPSIRVHAIKCFHVSSLTSHSSHMKRQCDPSGVKVEHRISFANWCTCKLHSKLGAYGLAWQACSISLPSTCYMRDTTLLYFLPLSSACRRPLQLLRWWWRWWPLPPPQLSRYPLSGLEEGGIDSHLSNKIW